MNDVETIRILKWYGILSSYDDSDNEDDVVLYIQCILM